MPIYSKDIDPWVPLHSSIGSGPRGNGFYVSSVIYTSTNTDIYSVYVGSLQGPDVEDVHDGDLIAFKSKFGEMTFYHIGVITSRSSSYLTVRSVLRSDEWSVDQLQMKNDWEELKVLVDDAIDNAESATDDMNDLIDQIRETLEGGGFKGDKGDKGDAFVFEDFTDAQLLDLRRDVSSIYYRRVSNVYITDDGDKTGNVAIPLDASVFDSSTMLFVFVNGLLCGTNEYTVLADGTVVRFNHAFSVSGTRIDFIGIKAIAITAEDYDALKGDPAPAEEVSAAVAAYLQSHPELVFVGATSSADGRDGLVPGPTTWARNAALFGDGSWSRIDITNDPTVTTGYSISIAKESESDTETLGSLVIPVATSSAIGMMSAEDKAKLDGISDGASKVNFQLAFHDGITWAEITRYYPGGGQFSLPFANLDNSHHVRVENLPEIPEGKIANDAVTSAKLAGSSVTNEKLASNSVTTAKITDGSITTPKLADVSVTTEKLANSSITAFKICDGVITDEKLVQSGGVLSRVSTLEDKTRLVTQATNGLMSAADKTKLDNMGDGTIPAGSITTPKLADSAVITQKIADNAVTVDKLANDVIDSIKSDIQPTIDAAQSAASDATAAAAEARAASAATWLAGNVLFGELAEGAVLTADDVYAAPPKGVEVFGVSTQLQTTGKNLLSDDMNDWPYTTISGANRPTLSIPVEDGATYTYHRNLTGTLGIIAYWYNEATQESAYAGQASGWTNYATQTVTNNGGWTHLTFSCTGISSSTLHAREAQLEKGSTFTSYEPYSGGVASPQPDWPQPIKSVDDLTLVLCGKNLFDPSHLLEASGWTVSDGVYTGDIGSLYNKYDTNDKLYPISGLIGTQQSYTVSLDYVPTDASKTSYIGFAYTDGTQFSATNIMRSAGRYSFTSDGSKTLAGLFFTYANGQVVHLSNIQFELGDAATPYTPYTGQSVEIPLSNNEARSLPDGTRDTLTLSYIGPSTREGWGVFGASLEHWVDEVHVTEAIRFYNNMSNCSSVDIYFGTQYVDSYSAAGGKGHIASNRFKDVAASGNYVRHGEMCYYKGNGVGSLGFERGTFESVADANAWLAENPTYVYLALTTPTIIDLGTVELSILPCPLTAWADGGSAQPTIQLEYERALNIVIPRIEAAISDLATS